MLISFSLNIVLLAFCCNVACSLALVKKTCCMAFDQQEGWSCKSLPYSPSSISTHTPLSYLQQLKCSSAQKDAKFIHFCLSGNFSFSISMHQNNPPCNKLAFGYGALMEVPWFRIGNTNVFGHVHLWSEILLMMEGLEFCSDFGCWRSDGGHWFSSVVWF